MKTETIRLGELSKEGRYAVTDADTGTVTTQSATELARTGLAVSFDSSRQSAIYWLDPAP